MGLTCTVFTWAPDALHRPRRAERVSLQPISAVSRDDKTSGEEISARDGSFTTRSSEFCFNKPDQRDLLFKGGLTSNLLFSKRVQESELIF